MAKGHAQGRAMFSPRNAFIFTQWCEKSYFSSCKNLQCIKPREPKLLVVILLKRKELLICTASEFLQSQAVGESDVSPSVSHKNPLQQATLSCVGSLQHYFKQGPKITLVLSCNIYQRARAGTEPRGNACVSISNTSKWKMAHAKGMYTSSSPILL